MAAPASAGLSLHGSWSETYPAPMKGALNGAPCALAKPLRSALAFSLSGPVPRTTALPPSAQMATVITRGNPRLPEVALTFDDGPSEFTPQVLTILERYSATATFFTIGQHIVQYPG